MSVTYCQARKEKEKAIVNKFALRIENGLKKLQLLTLHPTIPLRNRDKLQRKIGSLLGKNSRAAKMFDIKVEQVVSSDKKQRLSLSWQKKDNEDSWIDTSSGCYLLRTNIPPQLTAEEMWNAYIGLTKIEAAFRTLKSELVLRPIWHQKEDRVKAHIFICFLALILMRTFEYALQNVGLGNSPRKVLQELKAIKLMDVILPMTTGKELKIKVISQPEQSLKILMQHAKIHISQKLESYKTNLLPQQITAL